jgi:hypothetical protein
VVDKDHLANKRGDFIVQAWMPKHRPLLVEIAALINTSEPLAVVARKLHSELLNVTINGRKIEDSSLGDLWNELDAALNPAANAERGHQLKADTHRRINRGIKKYLRSK